MHRVPRDRDALGLESGMELLDAERAARVSEQMSRQPSQAGDIAHPVPLDNVPQDRDIHVVAQQLMT